MSYDSTTYPPIWHPSIDAVTDRFATTTAAGRLNFLIHIHVPVYTVQYNRQFLKWTF